MNNSEKFSNWEKLTVKSSKCFNKPPKKSLLIMYLLFNKK